MSYATSSPSTLRVAVGRYGALIVDEAQDFHEDWWLPLQLLLEDPDDSPALRVLRRQPADLPGAEEPARARRALPADTQLPQHAGDQRAREALSTRAARSKRWVQPGTPAGHPLLQRPKRLLEAARPERSPVGREGRRRTRRHRTAHSEGRSPKRPLAESSHSAEHLSQTIRGRPGILRTSIYKFKGLERLVVGVVELESVRDEIFYVGFSRPNVFLSIFAPESAREKLQRLLRG